MRVTRFEDLVAWQLARELTRDIYAVTRGGVFSRDRSLAWQMRSASTSIMANLAEGFDRHGPAEFHRYVCIAHASCSEVRSHLYVAFDSGSLTEEQFEELKSRTLQVDRLLRKLRASLEKAKEGE